jgi:hypothetical protein
VVCGCAKFILQTRRSIDELRRLHPASLDVISRASGPYYTLLLPYAESVGIPVVTMNLTSTNM